MNVKNLHMHEKPVSAVSLFKSGLGNASAIKIFKAKN